MTNPLYDRLFGRHADRDTPFLQLGDGTTLTHAAFLRIAGRFANLLMQLGMEPGDRLAVQVGKCPEMLALYAACAQRGVIFLPLNTAYTGDELAYFIENSGARIFVCDPKDAETLAPMAAAASAQLLTMNGSVGTFPEMAAALPDISETAARAPDDLAAFLYTSGTTGRSKGAMLTQENLLSNAEALASEWRFTEQDVLLHALPIFHTHGLFVATNVSLIAGGSMIFLPKFNADRVVAELPRATTMMGVPTFYTRLLDHPEFTKDLVGHMRLFVSGSAPLLAETHTAFEARTGHRILERYGMTETNMNTSNPYDGERRAGTVGFPLPGVDLCVTDPATGDVLPDGEIGVIEVRGPNVFKGYWQMPDKTREELRDTGFFITGDLGLIDADGYVQIVGRGKDLIIAGGFNVYPKEVEDLLDQQPGVLESAVVAAPHPDMGEGVVAVLVPQPGEVPDLDGIRKALDKGLARFKHPRHFAILDALPRNTMGKVQKAALRDDLKTVFTG